MAAQELPYHERLYSCTISDGPFYKCECCSGLFFKSSMKCSKAERFLSVEGIRNRPLPLTINLCNTCHKYILRKAIPPLAMENGLSFPVLPEALTDLTPLEERMVSPYLPFMQIRRLGIDQQKGVCGNVVSVPVNVDSSVSILPRMPNETQTVQLKLMRKMNYKTPYLFETVRPKRIIDVASYLVKTPLYMKNEITLSTDLTGFGESGKMDFVVDDADKNIFKNLPHGSDQNKEPVNLSDSDDAWEEKIDDESLNTNVANGNLDTLLLSTDDIIPAEIDHIKFAPGEGHKPQSILLNDDIELLSFPSIYGGQERNITGKISYADIVKWELRNSDRRCALNISKLFYSYIKSETIKLKRAIQVCMRKTTNKSGRAYTAADLKNPSAIDTLTKHDDGYKILECVQSSPAYWRMRQKELLAMVRQLGNPTFFLTLSAAETRWSELLEGLCLILGGNPDEVKEYVDNLEFRDKAKLINEDPVTCCRYFDHRLRAAFKYFKSVESPFGQILDYYIRIEFQARGSPHAHCLLFIKDAPQLNDDFSNYREVVDFIDSRITCSLGNADEDWKKLVKLQTHRHSRTCRKKNEDKSHCRFGIPFPPMPESVIYDPKKRKDHQNGPHVEDNYKKVKKAINDLTPNNAPETFDEFLRGLNMTLLEYIDAITLNIKRKTVLLKRSPKEIRINPYNKKVLELWKANMDIQFILDVWAVVNYIISYIGKSHRGMSDLLREAVKESKKNNMSIIERMRFMSNKFLNSQEVSAQECCCSLLRIPVSRSSRKVIYIHTSPPEERVHILKSKSELNELPDESLDVFAQGLIEHYIARPDELENTCLASFAAWYEYSRTKRSNAQTANNENEVEMEEDAFTSNYIKLKDSSGYIRKRVQAKIIRFRNYNMQKDKQNFFRELLMLYMPFRNENTELVECNQEELYNQNEEAIINRRREFVSERDATALERATRELNENEGRNDEEIIQPMMEHQNERDQRYTMDDPDHFVLSTREAVGDIGRDLEPSTSEKGINVVTVQLNNDEYYGILRKLNEKQREIFLYVLNHFKTGATQPLRLFISGGAGVGKSLLIQAMYEALTRLFNSEPGVDPSKVSVLRTAFTGKAAFNIEGVTLHSAFGLPVSQFSGVLGQLDSESRNRMMALFSNLKLLIIDEISLVGAKIFKNVHVRLQDILGNSQTFGGLSMIVVGDFHQLPPVCDNPIFKSMHEWDNPYGPLAGSPLWSEFNCTS